MLGLDYNERVSHEMQHLPFSYYLVDQNHTAYFAPAHWHRQLEIVHILEGTLQIFLDERQYTVTAGDMVYINLEVIHSFAPDNCVYEIIDFDADKLLQRTAFCKDALQIFVNHKVHILPEFPIADERLCDILRQLFSLTSNRSDANNLMALGTLFEFLGYVYANHKYADCRNNSGCAKAFRSLLDYIEESYMKPITLADMADVSKMSPSHFSALFRDFFHQTPIDYLNTYRIERASLMLTGTEHPITDIAYRCGFNDSAYFAKVFRKYKGMTPKKYRMLSK